MNLLDESAHKAKSSNFSTRKTDKSIWFLRNIHIQQPGDSLINSRSNEICALLLTRMGLVEDDTLILDLEPLHGVLLGDPLVDANAGLAPAAAGNTVSSTLQNDVEVHTIDTSGWVVPDKATKVGYPSLEDCKISTNNDYVRS